VGCRCSYCSEALVLLNSNCNNSLSKHKPPSPRRTAHRRRSPGDPPRITTHSSRLRPSQDARPLLHRAAPSATVPVGRCLPSGAPCERPQHRPRHVHHAASEDKPSGKHTVQPSHSSTSSVRMSGCQAGRGGGGLDNCSSWRTSVSATAGRANDAGFYSYKNSVKATRNYVPLTNLPVEPTAGC